jgi:hypothetical protein
MCGLVGRLFCCWEGQNMCYTAYMRGRSSVNFFSSNYLLLSCSEDRDVVGRMGSEWNLGWLAGGGGAYGGSGYGMGVGCCEHSDGPSGSGATELVTWNIYILMTVVKILCITETAVGNHGFCHAFWIPYLCLTSPFLLTTTLKYWLSK